MIRTALVWLLAWSLGVVLLCGQARAQTGPSADSIRGPLTSAHRPYLGQYVSAFLNAPESGQQVVPKVDSQVEPSNDSKNSIPTSGVPAQQPAHDPSDAKVSPVVRLQVDVGLGHESQSSPLFQLTPESTIIYQGGVDRLSGSHMRTALQGSAEWALEQGKAFSLAADATFKRSPGTPGFDFGALSVTPTFTMPVGAGSVGVGGSLQSIDVAGQHFRETAGMQLNWTQSDGTHLWGVVAETSRYFHADAMADMDADAASIVMLRQIGKPLAQIPALESIDFTAIIARENNLRGISELSNHSGMLSVLLRGELGDALGNFLSNVQWSVGRSWRHARFDGVGIGADTAREDRTAMLDLALQWSLRPGVALRLEMNEAHNVSTVRLFDNLYHQFSLTLRSTF